MLRCSFSLQSDAINRSLVQVQEANEVFRRYCLRQAALRGPLALHAPSTLRTESVLVAAAGAVVEASGRRGRP